MLATALLLALVLVATALSAGTSAPIAGPGAVPAPPLARSDAAAWAQVPALARLAISRGIGADQSAYWVTPARDGLSARNPTQGLTERFGDDGVTVATAGGSFALSLQRVLADGRALPAGHPLLRSRANRVWYDRGAVTEWYSNGPLGLEQGFSVSRDAAASARHALTLSLALQADGGLRPVAAAGGVELLSGHRVALRYDGLRVLDARGRALPATMTLRGSRVTLRVRTSGAAFPLTVDPIVQAGELTAADGVGGDGLGQSVAISGSLIAVGASNATVGGQTDAGAVYLFTQPTSGWAADGSAVKLTNATPAGGAQLGQSVAISGTTVVAGAPNATVGSTSSGGVYLFNEPASGWASETESGLLSEPSPSAGDEFGASLAASGSTVVVGAPFASDFSGSVYVFNEPASGWASEGPVATLTTDASGLTGLGFSVAVSGSTIVAGAPLYTSLQGQVDVFSEPAGGWANETETALLNECASSLTCPSGTLPGAAGDGLGQTVGVSGTTVVAGAPGVTVGPPLQTATNTGQGAVLVFNRPSSDNWADADANGAGGPESAELIAPNGGPSDALGGSLAIAGTELFAGAAGATVGGLSAQGAVYLFGEAGGNWAENFELSETPGAANDNVGTSVAVSGGTLVTGADGETVGGGGAQGAAFVFTGVPVGTTTGSGGGSTGGGSSGGGGSGSGTTSRNYATVISVSGGARRATVSLKCFITAGKCVAANVKLVVREKLQGRKVVATLAKAKPKPKSKFTYKTLVIGTAHVTLSARQHTTLVVSLNSTGRRIFGTDKKLSVGLSVTSTGRTLRTATVTITKAPPPKKKSSKPAKKK